MTLSTNLAEFTGRKETENKEELDSYYQQILPNWHLKTIPPITVQYSLFSSICETFTERLSMSQHDCKCIQ